MRHLDLFSGIGGFSLAVDRVWHEEKNEHIFVEWDDFCTAVLKKHWPEAEYHKDIKRFVEDTKRKRQLDGKHEEQGSIGDKRIVSTGNEERIYLLTGGFPCQPFSHAGRRKGTDDDRYLWPAMFEAITLFKPRWVIAENVAGLVTWNDGMVLETVCADLESEGYEVQPFIIPAVSVGAPHRRDRVWIVAHSEGERGRGESVAIRREEWRQNDASVPEREYTNSNATNSECKGRKQGVQGKTAGQPRFLDGKRSNERPDWSKNWIEVATRLCRVDDGVPRRLDRNPRLKALGNAIVPQVAMGIMSAIKESDCIINTWTKRIANS